VSIEGDDCEDTFYCCDLLTPIEVLTKPLKILNEQIAEQYSYQNPLNFQEKIVERVCYSVEELLNSCASASFVHSSLLLTGAKGSGKSTLLKRIKHFIGNKSLSAEVTYFESKLQNIKQNYSQVLDYNLSFSSQSDQLQQQKARDIDASSIRTSHFAESLKILLREIFSVPENQIEDLLRDTSHVVTIFSIDDLDLLFHPFKHDYSMVSLSGASFLLNQYFQSIAYHLKVVLQFLSRNAFQCKMLFLGTTSYSNAEIPSSQLGCPSFELMLSIPKPSFADRCHLVYEELQSMASFPFEEIARSDELQSDLFNIFPDLPTSSSSVNQNLMVWAYQIAGLTRGYLPADIAAILKKAIVLKYQRSASSTSPTTGNNELTWEIILESIAMTPLHSIEDLEVTQNYEIAKNLSWNHFGGYSEIKQKLQTILRPFLKQQKAPQPSEGAAVSGGSVTNKGKSLLQQFKFPRGMILHGPSGCGKTFLSKIIGKEVNYFLFFFLLSLLIFHQIAQCEYDHDPIDRYSLEVFWRNRGEDSKDFPNCSTIFSMCPLLR
jgi:SpoVK/Ycf46/Vps4 family AAA+-type ATPase